MTNVQPSLISIVMPVYNTGEILRETIDSVLAQTYVNFELIMIDDGSQSETSEIAKGYSDPRIRYYYQENRGMAAARNRGIKLSRGEYIAFLDHDDVWLPEKLEKQLAVFQADPSVGIVFSPVIFFDSRKTWLQSVPAKCNWKDLLKSNFIHTCSCVMVKRQLIVSADEFFDPASVPADDYDLWLRIGQNSKIVCTPEALVRYRIHANNASGSLNRIHRALLYLYPKISSRIRMNPEYSGCKKWLLLAKLHHSHAWACRTCSAHAWKENNRREAVSLAWKAVRLFPLQPANWVHALHLMFSRQPADKMK